MAESPNEAKVGEELSLPDAALAPEAEAPPEAESLSPPPTAVGAVLLRDRYLIDFNMPLTDMDTPSAKAYTVEDRRDLGRKLFGLVCTPGLPTRTDAMGALKDKALDGLMPLVEWDAIDCPLLGQRSMIVIYQRPLGGRVMDAIKAGTFKFTEYDFPRSIMAPLIDGLKNIHTFNIPHREIRPDNVFFMDKAQQVVGLGDCATVPPGFDQPPMFEPIDRSMAQPGGRGLGGLPDDVYALGVTFVVLMLGYNPVANISEENLIRMKMEQGSYVAICGNAHFPVPLLEPLRGMLNDAKEERWGLEELTGWLTGQKQASIKHIPVPIAKSDFLYSFEGHDHITPRTLAHYLSRHRETAMEAIKDEALIGWLRKGIQDANLADGIKAAVETAALHKDEPQGTDDFVIAKACMVLDPYAPVRYKGFTFMPDGFGPAMAVEILRRGDAKLPMEVLAYDLPILWYTLRKAVFSGASVQQTEYIRLKSFLNIRDLGYGHERCLYETNPSMPCQSPLLLKDYVVNIEDLLPALDAAANRVDTKNKPMDRHIAAFIAARFEEDIHPHLKAVAAPNEETATIGMLSLLAFLQWKLRINTLFGLSSWVGGLLGPAINAYHSRITRREIEKEIPRLVRKGSLPELFDLIDNAENRKTDAQGYIVNCAEYAALEREVRDLEGSGTELQTKAERTGKQASAVISILMAMSVMSILLIAEMF